jgi:autotransporter-associated beta strand protein
MVKNIMACITTLKYTGPGHVSNANIVLMGDGVIDASGAGPLVLTANITHGGICQRTLTLTGDSTQLNELAGIIQNASGGTNVDKTGPGTWLLSADSPYAGRLRVLDGTLVVGSDVLLAGTSPFGLSFNPSPILGSDASSGTAAMLFQGVGVGRSFSVSSGSGQVAVIGNLGTGLTELGGQVTLNRSVTLQSSSGGVLLVSTTFNIPVPGITLTIGSAGNDGTVVFLPVMSVLNHIGTIDIVAGTLVVETLVSGPPNVSSSTFTPTTLVVEFTSTPSTGQQYRLLPGATAQTYASVTLNGAGGATGTYDSNTSTLTIN